MAGQVIGIEAEQAQLLFPRSRLEQIWLCTEAVRSRSRDGPGDGFSSRASARARVNDLEASGKVGGDAASPGVGQAPAFLANPLVSIACAAGSAQRRPLPKDTPAGCHRRRRTRRARLQ